MKVLCEDNIPSRSVRYLQDNFTKLGDFGVIREMNEISKALNAFQPNILVLTSKNITPIVRAYSDRNNAKIICIDQVPHNAAHYNILPHEDIARANLGTLEFQEDVDKTDISVFLTNEGQKFIAEFLCVNYNVKVYGPVKINHPRYLGHITTVDKYDVMNKSQYSIVFDGSDAFDSILLGSYPVIYSTIPLTHKTFTNMVSLTDCMEYIENESNTNEINNQMSDLKDQLKTNNSISFTRDILKQLGLPQQAEELNNILKEQL